MNAVVGFPNRLIDLRELSPSPGALIPTSAIHVPGENRRDGLIGNCFEALEQVSSPLFIRRVSEFRMLNRRCVELSTTRFHTFEFDLAVDDVVEDSRIEHPLHFC